MRSNENAWDAFFCLQYLTGWARIHLIKATKGSEQNRKAKMNKRQVKKRNKQIARAAAILGALGGASKSPAKAMASRVNGQKGGRPRKDSAKDASHV